MLVFISHSSKDRSFVEQKLRPFLHDHGVSTWYSTAEIKTADDWEAGIRSGLKASDSFLVILSPDAIQSDWVRAEVHWAMKNRKGKVVPVLVAPCDPDDLHLQLALIQHVNLQADDGAEWRRLADIWPNESKSFKRGATSFTFLGRVDSGHQVFLFRKALLLATWNGAEFRPIDMFKTPDDNPVISSLQKGTSMEGGEGQELFTIPDGAGWSVRFYRLDFPDEQRSWFSPDILRAVNDGQFYVVPVQASGISVFGAETMKAPLLTAMLSCTSKKGELSVLVAVSPGKD